MSSWMNSSVEDCLHTCSLPNVLQLWAMLEHLWTYCGHNLWKREPSVCLCPLGGQVEVWAVEQIYRGKFLLKKHGCKIKIWPLQRDRWWESPCNETPLILHGAEFSTSFTFPSPRLLMFWSRFTHVTESVFTICPSYFDVLTLHLTQRLPLTELDSLCLFVVQVRDSGAVCRILFLSVCVLCWWNEQKSFHISPVSDT